MTTTLADFEPGGSIQLSDEEFLQISDLVYSKFGIKLTEKKKALVKGRLGSLMRSQGYSTFKEYLEALGCDESGSGLLSLVDRISTNHSYFFREPEHFDYLCNQALPEMFRLHDPADLRIWSAGCAAGEEPYTLAMVLSERFDVFSSPADAPILATDISMSALEKAAKGVYPPERLKNVDKKNMRHFLRKEDGCYAISERMRRLVVFKRLNFMRPEFPFRGLFNVVFCRNVMIYFDRETRQELVQKFYRYLQPGGYLFIGHSESLGRDTQGFQYIRPTVYRKW
jgi:chemotaxis protein methyltransferase CheR